MFKLQDFLANVRELARKYQFQAEIVFPTVIGSSQLVNLLLESTDVPNKQIASVSSAYAGQPMFLAGKSTFSTWSCTFRIDDNYDIYKKFRAWNELVVGTQTNIASFPSQYKSSFSLYQLDSQANRLIAFDMVGAWISNIDDSPIDYSSKEISTVRIDFEYDYHTVRVL
jgi:hypothetical protein